MELEGLPLELLCQIMESIGSPRALYRLISASSHCLRIFSKSPERFLTSVLTNAVSMDTVHHMLAVIHAPQIDISPPRKEKLKQFLKKYFKSKSAALPTTKAGLVVLYRLNTLVSGFVDDYFEKAMHKANLTDQMVSKKPLSSFESDGMLSRDASTSSCLSEIERLRLKRAFLRFELYCRIFQVDYERRNLSNYRGNQQSKLFVAHLTPCEVEEICCVQQYFGQTIRGYIDDLKDKFVEKFLSSEYAELSYPRSTVKRGPGDPMPSRMSLTDMNTVYGEDLAPTRLKLFSAEGTGIFSRHISFLTSLGFQFITDLLHGDRNRRTELIQANTPLVRDFWPEALRHTPQSEREIVPLSVYDSPWRPSFGYCTFRRLPADIYTATLYDDSMKSTLREMGYVFWDSRRILHPTFYNELNVAKSEENHMQNMPFERSLNLTAEERLQGVRMDRRGFCEIEEEFGSTSPLFIHSPIG